MATGRVKLYMYQRGFGFIYCDDGGELFFHAQDVNEDNFLYFTVGDKVTYEVGSKNGKPRAINIYRIKD